MNAAELSQYLTDTFAGVDVVMNADDSFFFYNPDSSLPPDHKFPFITIVTRDDEYDQFSNLNRPSVFRLSVGVGKQTFRSLFDLPERKVSDEEDEDNDNSETTKYDFTALDQLMPHPTYGKMYWVIILNPSDEMFETKVRPLLTEAYE